jgi:hypothetical protein
MDGNDYTSKLPATPSQGCKCTGLWRKTKHLARIYVARRPISLLKPENRNSNHEAHEEIQAKTRGIRHHRGAEDEGCFNVLFLFVNFVRSVLI